MVDDLVICFCAHWFTGMKAAVVDDIHTDCLLPYLPNTIIAHQCISVLVIVE